LAFPHLISKPESQSAPHHFRSPRSSLCVLYRRGRAYYHSRPKDITFAPLSRLTTPTFTLHPESILPESAQSYSSPSRAPSIPTFSLFILLLRRRQQPHQIHSFRSVRGPITRAASRDLLECERLLVHPYMPITAPCFPVCRVAATQQSTDKPFGEGVWSLQFHLASPVRLARHFCPLRTLGPPLTHSQPSNSSFPPINTHRRCLPRPITEIILYLPIVKSSSTTI
jgi:hypothetical protein